MEEGVDEKNQVEGTSSVGPPPVEEFINEKEKQHGEQKQKELTRRILSFRKRKIDENTAFSTGSSLPFMHCQFLCIISWSHHFNIQNKNFPLRVILCLHLLRCVNILLRQSKKTIAMPLKKVYKERKERMRRIREGKICFFWKE